ncbi:peptide deformylase [Candidatus Omnitrophota bacterium]
MSALTIVKYPNEILKKKALPVESFDESLRQLIQDMTETMIANDGVGLAAPQVGTSIRLFLAAPQGGKGTIHAFINPEIINHSGKQCGPEGCLSVPGVFGDVERAKSVTVRYVDSEGNDKEIKADGFLARIIQHENDHLNGEVFVDHLGFSERKDILDEYKRLQHISL